MRFRARLVEPYREIGCRVMVVHVEGDRVTGYKPFITGFMQDQRVWGRSADVQPLPTAACWSAAPQRRSLPGDVRRRGIGNR
jgi:hypothetical protein